MALIFRSVDWGTQAGKGRDNRWAGMVQVASRADTIGELATSLCQKLGVGAPWSNYGELTVLIDACEPHANDLLDWVARESVIVAAKAGEVAWERNT